MKRSAFARFVHPLAPSIAALALLVAAPLPAIAADDASATTEQAAAVSEEGREFLQKVARANEKEIAFAQLALEQSQNEKVRDYARKIVNDHKRASQKLQSLAQEVNVSLKPEQEAAEAREGSRGAGSDVEAEGSTVAGAGASTLVALGGDEMPSNPTETEEYQELAQANGKAFDDAFIETMSDSHEELVERFEEAAEEIEHAQIQSFAENQLPLLRQHLEHAQQVGSIVAE